jgi:uncharacterized protein YceH (UPF0502 family)
MCAGVSFDLEPNEIRVLGALLEKQRTTPDAYPLSLNALRAACNQSTNRDPVVDYDEATIRDALHRLSRRRWARLASGPGSRAAKYRQLVDETLGLGPPELSVLAVLMLRGPQTPGELRQRTERLHAFPDAAALHAVLDTLIEREMVARLERRPGQKEERYAHLLAGEDAVEAAAPAYVPAAAATPDIGPRAPAVAGSVPAPAAATSAPASAEGDRLARAGAELRGEVTELRGEVTELRGEVAGLREEVAALRRELGG